jgi:hypothetical protein
MWFQNEKTLILYTTKDDFTKTRIVFSIYSCSITITEAESKEKTWCMGPYAVVDFNLTSARNYRHSFHENKPKTLVFYDRLRAFWACFHEKFGHLCRLQSRPQHIYHRHGHWATLCQSRLYSPVRDLGFGLHFTSIS